MPNEEAKGGRPVRKKSRFLRYLLLAVLATSLGTSATLAKYASQTSTEATMQVAAFAGGGTVDFDVVLEKMSPGQTKSVPFTVQNYDGDGESDVMLNYSVQVETTGNLPLEFTLQGDTQSGDSGSADGTSVTAGPLEDGEAPHTKIAKNGVLPPVAVGGRKQHSYRLDVTWNAGDKNEDYSHEIDLVTVTVTTVQAPTA